MNGRAVPTVNPDCCWSARAATSTADTLSLIAVLGSAQQQSSRDLTATHASALPLLATATAYGMRRRRKQADRLGSETDPVKSRVLGRELNLRCNLR